MCACRAALARRYKIVGYGVKPHVQKWAHLNDGTVELVRAACAATPEWRNGATCHHRTRRRQSFYPSAHARTDLCAPGNASFLHFSIPSKGYGALPHVCPWPLTFRARMPKTRNLQLPPNFTALPTGGAAPQTETADCCAPLIFMQAVESLCSSVYRAAFFLRYLQTSAPAMPATAKTSSATQRPILRLSPVCGEAASSGCVERAASSAFFHCAT